MALIAKKFWVAKLRSNVAIAFFLYILMAIATTAFFIKSRLKLEGTCCWEMKRVQVAATVFLLYDLPVLRKSSAPGTQFCPCNMLYDIQLV